MLTLYRLSLGDPLAFSEQVGDPVTNQGGAPVPATRAALKPSISLSTLQSTVTSESVEQRLRLRRQLRSLLNNTPFKLCAYYLALGEDIENSGWYMPDQASFTDLAGQSEALATGIFKVEGVAFVLAGKRRTHRRAMACSIKDLRGGLWPRDYRRVIFSTNFSVMTALSLTYLPPSIEDVLSTGAVTSPLTSTVSGGADGSFVTLVQGVQDLSRISYEQSEANRNKGQVVAYDRRGQMTGPTTGPGTAWEEFYGPDYPYSWLNTGGTMDCPVLENGRCRVRWDPTHQSGWIVDFWTGAAWEEQGKMTVAHMLGESEVPDQELYSASLVEYSETRAVIQAVVKTGISGRDEIFITVQQGWAGPRFEVYAGNEPNGEKGAAALAWTVAGPDADASAYKQDAAAAVVSTAMGTGHTGQFAEATLGAATFTGENWVILNRWGAARSVTFSVVQASLKAILSSDTEAYGVPRNSVAFRGPEASGYVSVALGFLPLGTAQALEAESMTLGTGTASTVDTAASNKNSATATRTTDANAHVTQAAWPVGPIGKFRIFARVKSSVLASKVKIYAKSGATTGVTQVVSSEAYTWVELGELASGSSLEIHAWLSAAGTLSVDRIEIFQLEDRELGRYEGVRDRGQYALMDSRTTPTIVTRSV
jgi:hypothetical protein